MIRIPALNSWFLFVSLLAGYGLVAFLPQKLPRSVAYLMMLFGLSLASGLDHSIGVKPIDLYDTNLHPDITFTDMMTWALYPVVAYLFVYLYDKLRVRGLGIPLYVTVWSLFGVGFETLLVYMGVFIYKGWMLGYSFVIYLVVQFLSVSLFLILMRLFIRSRDV